RVRCSRCGCPGAPAANQRSKIATENSAHLLHRVMTRLAHSDISRRRSTSVTFGAKRTSTEPRLQKADYEYTPFCNGPGDVKSPRVTVAPPSSCFGPWLALGPPHYAVRRNGEPI